MYLHCRYGFVEADAWDGATIPVAAQQQEAAALAAAGAGSVIVVRSRRQDTLLDLVEGLPRFASGGVLPELMIYESPPGWDYEWRCYLTATEWGACLTRVAMGLDYRNFKHTMQDESPTEYPLALAIWQDAHRFVERER